MPKLLGGTDTFIYRGKTYHRGEDVPISKELARHHAQYAGVRFEGVDPALEGTPIASDVSEMAFDDRGQAQPERKAEESKKQD